MKIYLLRNAASFDLVYNIFEKHSLQRQLELEKEGFINIAIIHGLWKTFSFNVSPFKTN